MNINFKNSLLSLMLIFGLSLSDIVMAAENKNSMLDFLSDDAPEETFLAPDVAFKLSLLATSSAAIDANFSIAPGHYLYKSRIKFESAAVKIASVDLPNGEIKNDATFGRQEVFHHDFVAKIKLATNQPMPKSIALKVTYQGCSEKGLCYAPIKKTINVELPTTNQVSSDQEINDSDDTTNILKTGNLWLIVAGFFVAGLLLSLTPCVLPMIPILSSIIVGSQSQQQNPSKLYAFLLSLAYVLGMALSYTLAGVAAGLSGSLISQSLQNAWVLGATALVFVLLALSMFGFYELKLPASFESKMLNTSNQLKGGKFFGVFIMGALSALIVSPCVAAPLAGALLYIGQTHNVLLGGVGLFALAIGMGVPLLLIGASAGSILPKAGYWMTAVRNFFGVLMLAMAIWIISPLLATSLVLVLWAVMAIIIAVYLHALEALPVPHGMLNKLSKGFGLLLFIYGVALLLGALSGGKSLLKPLEHWFNEARITQNQKYKQ